MNTWELLSSIDSELARLKEARALLAGQDGYHAPQARKRHTMTAEARERIAAAQRKRWAKQKRAAKKGS